MRLAPRLLIALALGLTAAFVAACGGGSSGSKGLLSQAQSATISTELSTIAAAIDNGACRKARNGLSELDATLRALPSSVNQRLVHNLGQGAATTRSLAMRDCARAHTPTTRTTTTTTTTTATTSSVATTQTPTQTPTQTQTQTETQTETQPATTTGQVGTGTVTTLPNAGGTTTSPSGGPPGGSNGGGNGGGNGHGNGGGNGHGNGAGGLNPGGGG